jgi:hypothetical protein
MLLLQRVSEAQRGGCKYFFFLSYSFLAFFTCHPHFIPLFLSGNDRAFVSVNNSIIPCICDQSLTLHFFFVSSFLSGND